MPNSIKTKAPFHFFLFSLSHQIQIYVDNNSVALELHALGPKNNKNLKNIFLKRI